MPARGFSTWWTWGGGAALSTPHLVLFGLLFICSLHFSVQHFCPPHDSPVFLFLLLLLLRSIYLFIHSRPKWKFSLRMTSNSPSFLHLPLHLKAFDTYPQLLYFPVDLCLPKLCISLSKEALNSTLEGCSLKRILLWPAENAFPCCHLWWLSDAASPNSFTPIGHTSSWVSFLLVERGDRGHEGGVTCFQKTLAPATPSSLCVYQPDHCPPTPD